MQRNTRNTSHTKRGPGREHKQGRDPGDRKVVKLRFGANLMAAWATLRANGLRTKRKAAGLPRDEHGAVTLVGSEVAWENVEPGPREFGLGGSTGPDGFVKRTRRIWLAGISAQRGF